MVLISNDDGISSSALQILIEETQPFADVWVVAPDGERSAQSMSLTVNTYIKLKKHGEQKYSVSGTPVDCVILAISKILPRKPDLVLSGINWGANMGQDTLFSGTVGIASAAALKGIPACGFSCEITHPKSESDRWVRDTYNFSACRKVIKKFWASRLFEDIPNGNLLNVNIPSMDADQLKGLKVSKLGHSGYDHNMHESSDPRGRSLYWYSGKRLANPDEEPQYDHTALMGGYASLTLLTPSLFQQKSHDQFTRLVSAKGLED